MAEKQYVNGLIIKEKVFENGGNQLKMSIKTDDMVKQLKELDDNGWVNLIVTRRKEPSIHLKYHLVSRALNSRG